MLAVVDATRPAPPQVLARLRDQLDSLGVVRTEVVGATGGLAAALRSVATLLREHDDALTVLAADIVAHRAAVGAVVAGTPTTTRVLVRTRADATATSASPARVERDRVVSTGTTFHRVTGANAHALDVVRVGRADRLPVADAVETMADLVDAGRLGAGELTLTGLVTVAAVRTAAYTQAADARTLFWRRVPDEAALAQAEADLASDDEEARALESAVKGEDEFFTTFFVSPYSRYVARWCARRGITPNAVTITSILLALGAAALFGLGHRGPLVAGAVLLQVSFTLDCVDGQLARYTMTFSRFGAWLDITFDRVKEFAIYAGLAVGAVRTGVGDAWFGSVWAFALAAAGVRIGRHLLDFSYAAAHTPAVPVASTAPLDVPADGLADLATGQGAPPSPARWLRRIAILPFGQRLALISVAAAVSNGKLTLVVLVLWASAATAYMAAGRVVRSVRA